MKGQRSLTRFALAAMLATCLTAHAEPGEEPPPSPKMPKATEDRLAKNELDRVNFSRTSLEEALAIMKKRFEDRGFIFNYVLDDAARSFKVTLDLRNVNVDQISSAIQLASGGDIAAQPNDGLYYFYLRTAPKEKPKSQVRIYNLSNLSSPGNEEKVSEEKMMAGMERTINEAMAMLQDADEKARVERPRLSYNANTHLLIVVGEPYALQVADEVVHALSGSSAKTVAPAPRPVIIPPAAPPAGPGQR